MSDTDTGSAQPPRGQVGRQTYEAVQRHVQSGMKATEAFARVAEETGRSAATVATAYYRVARKDPNSTVKQRPRTRRAPEPTPGRDRRRGQWRDATVSDTLDELIRRTQDTLRELTDLKQRVGAIEENAQRYEELARLVGR